MRVAVAAVDVDRRELDFRLLGRLGKAGEVHPQRAARKRGPRKAGAKKGPRKGGKKRRALSAPLASRDSPRRRIRATCLGFCD